MTAQLLSVAVAGFLVYVAVVAETTRRVKRRLRTRAVRPIDLVELDG